MSSTQLIVGLLDGCEDGICVGESEGLEDGCKLTDGASEAFIDGAEVLTLGLLDGIFDGESDGVKEGLSERIMLG